jgi:hypothetical protein
MPEWTTSSRSRADHADLVSRYDAIGQVGLTIPPARGPAFTDSSRPRHVEERTFVTLLAPVGRRHTQVELASRLWLVELTEDKLIEGGRRRIFRQHFLVPTRRYVQLAQRNALSMAKYVFWIERCLDPL